MILLARNFVVEIMSIVLFLLTSKKLEVKTGCNRILGYPDFATESTQKTK